MSFFFFNINSRERRKKKNKKKRERERERERKERSDGWIDEMDQICLGLGFIVLCLYCTVQDSAKST